MVDYSSSHLRLAADMGDNLHFGLACQQARADGIENVDILPVCHDVPVARSKAVVGRRALAGTILGMTFYGFVASFWRLFLFSSFQKLFALLQKPTGLVVTLSLNSARPSPEPSFQYSTIATLAILRYIPLNQSKLA